MKLFIITCTIFIIVSSSMCTMAQNVGIGISSPDSSAKLDINATNKGLLIPRVSLVNTASATPITAPVNSLLVYNIATTGNVTPGFYYWDGLSLAWVRLINDGQAWLKSGNSGITSDHFVGSINAADLIIKTSNLKRAVVTASGNFGIGDTTPASLFTVGNGDLFQVNTTGNARGINGTASSPSFSFVNDDDNGLYLSGTNELSFATAGAQRAVISSSGLLGVGATIPSTTVDINGDLALREGSALILVNGQNNNLTVGNSSHVRISGPTAAFSITGISGGVNGKLLTLINGTSQNMTIENNVVSTASNRIFTASANNIVLEGQFSSVLLQYNSTLTRWIVLSATSKYETNWKLKGNSTIVSPAVPLTYGTSTFAASENWLGTMDTNDVVMGTNNIERFRIKQTSGNIGIGDASPSALLTVGNGDLFQVNSTGHARGIAGTAATPSFSFATDEDNGMYLSTTNELSLATAGLQRAVISAAGRVGINAAIPNTMMDINGDLSIREGVAPVFANGVNSNMTATGVSHMRVTGPTAAFSITGFTGGFNGKLLTIINTTTQTMTISHNVSSIAANRIYVPKAISLILEGQYASVTLMYNSTLARWVVISSTDGLISDDDIYQVGTSISPDSIGDAKYTLGTLAIGHTDPLGHALLVGGIANNTIKLGQTGGLNNAESGRIIFDEGANLYSPGSYCGFEIHNDGLLNKLSINGGCIAPITIATFERLGNVGIAVADPTEQLEIGGTDSKIFMNSASSNMLSFNTSGVAAPAFTTRSLGTKLIMYPQTTATSVDYALGIASTTLWYSIPEATNAYSHRWYSGTTEGMRFRGDGRLGIGATNPTATRLSVFDPSILTVRVANFQNNAADGTEVQFGSIEYMHDYSSTTDFNNSVNSVGLSINLAASASYNLQLANNSAAKPGSNAWTIASDSRLKDDIQPFKDGLATLRQINPIYYKYNGKAHTPAGEYYIGILAQEMKTIAPYTIGKFEVLPDESNKDVVEEYLSYNSHSIDYVTINAIKELDQKQSKVEEVYKNISDFGMTVLTEVETFIPFDANFKSNLNSTISPVVTTTAFNSTATLTIVSQNTDGFVVRKSDASATVQINWIAMAKVKEHLFETNTNYTEAERAIMLSKVKATDGLLKARIAFEKEQLAKMQAENKEAEEKEKMINTAIEQNTIPKKAVSQVQYVDQK